MSFTMFSKMFGSLSVQEAGRVISDMGFDGVDLTVRPGGHVLPADVEKNLPTAVATLREMALTVPMITTAITSAESESAESIMAAASEQGITLLKAGYWSYEGFGHLDEQMNQAQRDLDSLAPLAEKHGVTMCLHIHSGDNLTAMPGLVHQLIAERDPDQFAAYLDLGHMTLEGGLSGWKLGMDLLAKRTRLVALKGSGWHYIPGVAGVVPRWERKMYPARDSMVPWHEAFGYLKEMGFDGPMSVHSEYSGDHSWQKLDLDGIIAQTRFDLEFFKSVLVEVS